MAELKLLRPTDLHNLDNIAEDVFDDPIVLSSAQEFLIDSRHRLVVALDNQVVVGFVSAVIYLHPDKPAPELWINEIGVAPHTSIRESARLSCRQFWKKRNDPVAPKPGSSQTVPTFPPWPCTNPPAEKNRYPIR
jgi:hypothetical protein